MWGARDAGVHAWLWGPEGDVRSFAGLAARVTSGSKDAPEEGEGDAWKNSV